MAPAVPVSSSSPPKAQRAHRPHDLGPRVYRRGRYYWADLRPWGGSRIVLRNPKAPGWPDRGDKTEDEDIADRWKWAYVDHERDVRRRRQLNQPAKGQRLARAIDAFLDDRETQVEPYTWRNDRTALRVHLLPACGADTPTDAIEATTVQQLVQRLAREGYAPGSLRTYARVFVHFFDAIGRRAADNPARGIALVEVQDDDVEPFTDAELESLRAAADRLDRGGRGRGGRDGPWRSPIRIRLAIELGLGMGGREGELFAVDWAQLAERTRTVRVTHQLGLDGSLKGLKGKRARTALVLPSWWAHHDRTATGRILATADGTPPRRSMLRWLKTLYREAGVDRPGRGWHTLRHTYSRLFIESGGRLEELQKSLGHKSIVTTETEYGHLHEDVAAKLARLRIYGEVDLPAAHGGVRAG